MIYRKDKLCHIHQAAEATAEVFTAAVTVTAEAVQTIPIVFHLLRIFPEQLTPDAIDMYTMTDMVNTITCIRTVTRKNPIWE